jgi:hypothetical protein
MTLPFRANGRALRKRGGVLNKQRETKSGPRDRKPPPAPLAPSEPFANRLQARYYKRSTTLNGEVLPIQNPGSERSFTG